MGLPLFIVWPACWTSRESPPCYGVVMIITKFLANQQRRRSYLHQLIPNRHYAGQRKIKVTGPLLTKVTCIFAPNSPKATCG